MFYFYILKCKDGSLYCGSAKDVAARVKKHNLGQGSKYVWSRGGGVVVYKERFRSLSRALKREAEVKKWPRKKKLNFIKNNTRIY